MVVPNPLVTVPADLVGVLVPAEVDPALLVDDEVTLPIQINGKRRGEITVPKGMAAAEVEKLVLSLDVVHKALEGKAPKKVVVVQDRIVNIVI